MKRHYVFLSFLFSVLSFCVLFIASSFAQKNDFPARPSPPHLVNDLAGILSPQENLHLERKLVAFDDSTSTQITVVIMESTGSYVISDYADRLGESWGIGRKGKNNGVILLVAKEDKHVTIQVGYGLEAVLTDALSKRIIETILVPAFKQGNYFSGIDEATSVMMAIAAGEFSADQFVKQRKRRTDKVPWGLLPILLIIIAIVIFSRMRSVSRYANTNNLSFWAALALMNAMSNRSHGSWGNFSSGGGDFGGGGGFGGFGGGSFGGGGASGSW